METLVLRPLEVVSDRDFGAISHLEAEPVRSNTGYFLHYAIVLGTSRRGLFDYDIRYEALESEALSVILDEIHELFVAAVVEELAAKLVESNIAIHTTGGYVDIY